MKSILILGTSNSIIKDGWVLGLKECLLGWKIDNKSIGASPGIQFLSLISLDFTTYDYVFFDSSPNDEDYKYQTEGYTRPELEHDLTFQLLSTIASQSNLIILYIPKKERVGSISEILLSRSKIAKELNCQLIDLTNPILSFGPIILEDLPLYERHPAHPKVELMRIFGNFLASFFINNRDYWVNTKLVNYSQNFITFTPKSDIIREFSNSLMSDSFAIFNESSQFNLSEYPSGYLIGFYINRPSTNCILNFDKKLSISLHEKNEYDIDNKKLIKVFIPIPDSITFKSLEIRDCKAGPLYVPILFDNAECIKSPPTSLAMGVLVYWNGSLSLKNECNSKRLSFERIHNSDMISNYIELAFNSMSGQKHPGTIKTNHETFLYYDSINNKIINTKTPRSSHHIIMTSNDKKCYLYVTINGLKRMLHFNNDSVHLVGCLAENCYIELITNLNYFTISFKNKYLSSKKDNHGGYGYADSKFSATEVRAWEKYHILPCANQ